MNRILSQWIFKLTNALIMMSPCMRCTFLVHFAAVCAYSESMTPVLIPSENIAVTSNSGQKEKLRPTSSTKWVSGTGATQQVITLTLPADSTIVHVSLVEPENVATYKVEIKDSNSNIYPVSMSSMYKRVLCRRHFASGQ